MTAHLGTKRRVLIEKVSIIICKVGVHSITALTSHYLITVKLSDEDDEDICETQ